MAFCTHCGTESGGKFCPICGNTMPDLATPSPATEEASPAPVTQPTAPMCEAPAQPVEPPTAPAYVPPASLQPAAPPPVYMPPQPPAYNVPPSTTYVPPYAPTYTPPAAPAPAQHKGLCVAGLVMGAVGLAFFWIPIIGMIIAIPGLILAVVGFAKSRPKTGLPLAAFIIACIGMVLSSLVTIGILADEAYLYDYDDYYYDEYDEYDFFDDYGDFHYS